MARRSYHLLSLMAIPLTAGAALLSVGCSSEANHESSTASPGGDQVFKPGAGGTGSGACATPDEGCACNDEGATDVCAEKLYQEGEYIQCIHGTRTCSGKVWGACDTGGGQVSSLKAPDSRPGYQFEGLGASQKCVNNPCNPYCNNYQDDPSGLAMAPDSGLQVDAGNLTLAPNPYWKPINITSFRIAPKPSLTITVTSIPQGQYPATSPTPAKFTAEFLCNTPAVQCNPPKFTAASWSLSDYSTALVGTDGTVSVVKPIPKSFVITGSAGGYSDTATINVVVNALDAPGIAQSVVDGFANATPTVVDDAIILYPYKNTLFPRGMTAPVLQWSGSATASYAKYSLRHKNAAGAYDFTWSKITSDSQRAYFPQNVWAQFDETASGGSAEIVLQRAAVTCAKPPAVANCSDYSYGAANYRFCSLGYNWNQARTTCKNMGMDFASINTSGENAFVTNVSGSIAAGSWWIGANDQATEGSFVWPDGTPVSSYTNWNGGEPNNWGGNEDCTELITGSGKWNDNNCAGGRYFICETAATGCVVNQVNKEIVIPIKFSSEPMQGSVFFWEINNGRIAKILDDGTLVQNFIQNAGRCMACHSVSADGGTLIAQADGGNGNGITYNAISGAKIYERGGANQFMAISPTGKWTIWGDWAGLSLSNSSAVYQYIPSTNGGNVAPSWSPLGNYISYAVRYTGSWYVDFSGSNLWRTTFSDPPVGNSYFSNTKQIVGGITGWPVVAYPTFSPDENYIVFQRANALRTRNNLGQLWISDNNGGGARELVTADTATYMTASGATIETRSSIYDTEVNYEPTFSPTTSGGYYWLVFISNRDYGNFSVNGSWLKDNGRKQMWVSAITANPGSSGDPSNPPMWLPGQDVGNQNMRGAFSKTACRNVNNACKWDEDCCGFAGGTAKCVLDQPVTPAATRHCGAFTPGQCVNNGGACTDGTQCCKNPKVLECIQGICSEPVPTPFYTPATYTRDYEGTCPQGFHVVWRLFSWKGTTPGDSSITVSAQTGLQAADLAAAPSAAVSQLLPAQCTAGYACGDVKVALDTIPSVSKQFLRVSVLLTPTSDNAQPPTISDWKQDYDCVPSELTCCVRCSAASPRSPCSAGCSPVTCSGAARRRLAPGPSRTRPGMAPLAA
jgi:hypothetical protein